MTDEQIDNGEKKERFIKLQTKLGVSFTILAIFISALFTISLFVISRRALYEGIRKHLHSAVSITSLQMDGDAHSKINSPEDENSVEYKKIQRNLQLIRDMDPEIVYAETMRLRPDGEIIFVVDVGTDPEEIAHVGEVYDAPTPLLKNNIATLDSPLVEPKLYTDEYGSWISAYAPFYTSDGRREGFVELDMSAARIKSHEGRFLFLALVIFLAMVPISLILGFGIGRRMAASIVKLTNGAERIAEGDLDSKVEVTTRDEVKILANTFNKMTEDLKQYIKDLQETTAAKERIEADLRIAHDIQVGVLPGVFPPFPDRKEFDIFASMEPAKEVGGDLYDFYFINEKKLFFIIGDVSGKGVPAALFMMITKALLKSEAMRDLSPPEILYRANNIICPDNDTSMFVTIFCAILDTETGELEFGNAGHNPPLIYRGGQGYEYIDMKGSLVLGPFPDIEFTGGKLKLNPGDIIFLYTDGVTEAINPQDDLFSDERLQESLSNLQGKGVTETLQGVREEVQKFVQGAPQSDDITMLAVKFNG